MKVLGTSCKGRSYDNQTSFWSWTSILTQTFDQFTQRKPFQFHNLDNICLHITFEPFQGRHHSRAHWTPRIYSILILITAAALVHWNRLVISVERQSWVPARRPAIPPLEGARGAPASYTGEERLLLHHCYTALYCSALYTTVPYFVHPV